MRVSFVLLGKPGERNASEAGSEHVVRSFRDFGLWPPNSVVSSLRCQCVTVRRASVSPRPKGFIPEWPHFLLGPTSRARPSPPSSPTGWLLYFRDEPKLGVRSHPVDSLPLISQDRDSVLGNFKH